MYAHNMSLCVRVVCSFVWPCSIVLRAYPVCTDLDAIVNYKDSLDVSSMGNKVGMY